MKGVVLAGGEGTRLGQKRPYNKQLSLVYDRLMIEYPVQTLAEMGCDSATIVSSPVGACDMFRVYREQINGLPVDFETQYHPLGPAHALGQTSLTGVFPVICGDVYLDPAPEPTEEPTLYWTEMATANQHSVYDPEGNRIVEKPVIDLGRRAVIAYVYDERVYDVINGLGPTERGEYELVDLHNWYLQNGAVIKEYKGFFGDMGTPDGLLRVANHIKSKTAGVLKSQQEVREEARITHAKAMGRKP